MWWSPRREGIAKEDAISAILPGGIANPLHKHTLLSASLATATKVFIFVPQAKS
jgi:hypothetical protein